MILTLTAMALLLCLVVLCYIMYKKYKKSNSVSLRQKMNRLWFDHSDRLSQYVAALVSGAESVDSIKNHVKQNQNDIGMFMAKYYDINVGVSLATLLNKQVDTLVLLISAIKEKKPTDVLYNQLNENTNEISEFLSEINYEEWKVPIMRNMMVSYLTEMIKYLELLISSDWNGAVKQHDIVVDQGQLISKVLGSGIINQFLV